VGFLITAGLQYWPALAVFAALLAAAPCAALALARRRFREGPVSAGRVALTAAIALPLFAQAYRGVVYGKPLGLIDAFSRGSSEYGNLVLNGAFSSVHASRRVKRARREKADERMIAAAAAAVVAPWEIVPVPECPLQRKVRPEARSVLDRKRNVVVVLMESFGREYVEACAHRGYNVSPRFDALAREGILFTNCYANGQRSVHGLAAVFLSVPSVPGLPYLGAGLEVAGVHRVGTSLARAGYRTIGVNSGPRRSYRTDAIASALGFREYVGKEDIPRRQEVEPGRSPPPFGWDYDGLMYALDVIDAKPGPFFAFAITGTPHHPYSVPAKRFEKYPHAATGLNGFLNTLYYADWALGAFMDEASKRPWFGETVFVITADHGLGFAEHPDPAARFGIPLLLLIPGASAAVLDRVASQADIWPTIVDLLGLEDAYAGIGRSLMRTGVRPFAFLDEGSTMVFVTQAGWMRHSRERRLDMVLRPDTAPDEADWMEATALAIDHSLFTIFNQNRFFREEAR
jgi:phosphoglycerol transferase MdoB-like AlkP superfamily enzyme